ncbi:MAG TPA: ATP-binding protein [Blastocatellia bacterium]|nr:ATP-binding protein [Blastocatellia bacterium]
MKAANDRIFSLGVPRPGDITLMELAPRADWSVVGEGQHFVQFYETDDFLLNSLTGFVGRGLEAGDACVVVATRAHIDGLEQRLREAGLDLTPVFARGQYVPLDAAETLSKLMVDGRPEWEPVKEVIGEIITRAAEGNRRVRIFGEMVALLWADTKHDAAVRLEELWNDLHRTHSFSLFCAYPMRGLEGEGLARPLEDVCGTHSHIIPAESYTTLETDGDRLRAILDLQRKAALLEAEIAERKEAEAVLRVVKDELEVQVEDLRRLHEMSLILTSTLDISTVLEEVLRAALSVQQTNMGLLSLHDQKSNGLALKVHTGFNEEFINQVEWVPLGAGACGACFDQRRRIVVEDTEIDAVFSDYKEAARRAAFRACHSTPLITRSGAIIGVLSVHFRKPHRPSEREMRLMDLYAQMAADFIENAQLHNQVQKELDEREQFLLREQRARAEAETANRMKDEFLATVSHELRTPLNAIIGWSHLLRTGRLDEATVERAVETIHRNAKAQSQLIEDILDMSRVITGKLRLQIAPVDMASVINAAIDSVQLAADSKSIKLEVTLDPSARNIQGDSSRLQQAVWNLLSNAIKFTPADGRIRVKLERAEGHTRITVSDTGEGITPDFLPFIFDRFRQADSTCSRPHGGLGLGLAIVRHLVELHGGTVQADSPGEGLGSTFTILLPLGNGQAR